MSVTVALLAVALVSGVTALAAWLDRRIELRHREWLKRRVQALDSLALGPDSG